MKNTLTLDMRSEEGRCQVSADIDHLTDPERKFVFGVLQAVTQGGSVGFSVLPGEDDQTKIVQFTLTNPIAASLATKVNRLVRTN